MKEKPDSPWPVLSGEQIRKIDYLFLTHCHADHTGALPWLCENGFRGNVIGSRATLEYLPCEVKNYRALEDFSKPLRETKLDDELCFLWGRSGHCIGSVWFLFRIRERRILFSGDYEERSFAYKCDKIRNISADLAVLDCAYGYEKDGADAHRKNIEDYLDEQKKKGVPMLFPVPSHGRGFDILRLLAERGITAVISGTLADEYSSCRDPRFWLKRGFLDSMKELGYSEIAGFEERMERLEEGDPFPPEYMASGVLVRDSQLYKEINQKSAGEIIGAGGRVVLTGKQDPSSFARMLFDSGKADFYRLSVHQNAEEMLRLAKRNSFRTVVPYHCREELSFSKKKYLVLKPGDRVRF